MTFAEVTARVRAEAAEQSERIARAIIASANEAVLVCDTEGIITHVNAAAAGLYDGDPVGMPFSDAVPLIFSGAGIMRADDIVKMAIAGTALQGVEVLAPNALKVKDYLVSAAPLQVARDQISGCVITLVDLSKRKAAEKQQSLLIGELNHRVNNTLALVLSICSHTLESECTLEDFRKTFTGRVQALAATHSLLADKSWTSLTIGDIVRSELAPYVDGRTGKLFSDGLDVAVVPRAAVALGLIIHELATNAVKYGALSCSGGSISVKAISRTGDDRGPFVIEWRETGGPYVLPTQRKGFGHTVISRSLDYSGQSGAELEFNPAGVICRIALPREDMVLTR